jgi:hypothetical protein
LTKKFFELESIHFYVKVVKTGEIKFLGHYWLEGRYLIRAEILFPPNPALSYIKRSRTLRRFQKYKLTFVKKIT